MLPELFGMARGITKVRIQPIVRSDRIRNRETFVPRHRELNLTAPSARFGGEARRRDRDFSIAPA
jgi:hypothetical protein